MLRKLQLKSETTPTFYNLRPSREDLFSEVLTGLQKTPKTLPPKFFYDVRGSNLFNQITQLKEYYLTRTEISILKSCARELAFHFKEDSTLIEYGCGNSGKVKILLDAIPKVATYVAVDISQQHLLELSKNLSYSYPHLDVLAVCADFTLPLRLPETAFSSNHKVAFFPGSSIGNFEPKEAQYFLENIAKTMGEDGGLLIGVDLKKDKSILQTAYNDSQGITAQFNLNLLQRINQECMTNFDLQSFHHAAFYNEEKGRIEMHLVSQEKQTVHLQGIPIHFEAEESIHTENSYKYHVEEFQNLAREAGWKPMRVWTDPQRYFSVHYLVT